MRDDSLPPGVTADAIDRLTEDPVEVYDCRLCGADATDTIGHGRLEVHLCREHRLDAALISRQLTAALAPHVLAPTGDQADALRELAAKRPHGLGCPCDTCTDREG